MRVLIVEDEKRLAATLRDLMEMNGFTADVCYDGESGLDNALSGIYDVMILDVMLPRKDGFTVLRELRKAGGEYGAATGRPRRVGGFDVPASRYGVRVQGADELAVTKLDVLSYLDKIPICAHYELNGEVIDEFPFPTLQSSAKPVMEYMEGWKCDISGVRKWEDLPEAARNYVQYVEEKIGCRIGYVSVGPERDSIILR